jgi:DNA-binding SARP family transcriptional activator
MAVGVEPFGPSRHGGASEPGSPGASSGDASFGAPLLRSKVRVPRVRALARERLDRLATGACRYRVTIVVAPAGSGKTTLLATWATAARALGTRVAWYRAESTDASRAVAIAYVQLAIAEALGMEIAGMRSAERGTGARVRPTNDRDRGAGGTWRTVEEAVAWLEDRPPNDLLLVVDDFHALAGSEAEAALERLVELTGPGLRVVLGARTTPSFNLPRWRLAGELLEVTGDDLRFRSWEVEGLFRDFYGEMLRGDELGRLARRTDGWAAGLQLFHLATTGKSPAERTRLLGELGGSPRLIREYLTRNVFDELRDELREFLLETCVLRRLSGSLCDRFLNRTGSGSLLAELERRQVFTISLDDGTYRYHDVLQAYLEQLLRETRGDATTHEAWARAARLLEEEGAVAEALASYCRSEEWDETARLLGSGGPGLTTDALSDWLIEVAPAVVRNDPWMLLATARRLRAEGHWARAIDAFAQAEAGFGASEAGAVCRRQRLSLAAFADPDLRPPAHWTGLLRDALRRKPMARRASWALAGGDAPEGPGERLVHAVAELAAGFVVEARAVFLEVSTARGSDPAITAAATIGAGTAAVLAGDVGRSEEIERGIGMAERSGQAWLASLGRIALVFARPAPTVAELAELRALRRAAAADDDGWTQVLSALVEGWALLRNVPEPGGAKDGYEAVQRELALAIGQCRRTDAGTLEAWARGLAALAAARLGEPEAYQAALQAESFARMTGVAGARMAVYLALADCDPDRSAEHSALAAALGRETGLAVPPPSGVDGPGASALGVTGEMDRPVEIRLLGGFSMRIRGRPVDLATIKPRPRAVLRFLALNAGMPVHREVLAEAFWPETDPLAAARNVHVALSGLRKALANGGDSGPELLLREGEAYRLVVPEGGWLDLAAVQETLAAARAAHQHRDAAAETVACRRAIELGGGELLPEDGPAEWVVYRREQIRTELAGAARSLAELIVGRDPRAAAEACAAGLRLDPHDDGLWRMLISAHDLAGDQAAAATARQGYARMLAQLGLPVAPAADAVSGV